MNDCVCFRAAISYLKKETETDTQPLLKDFISLSKPIREEHDEEGEELIYQLPS